MTLLNWLDSMFFGYRRIQNAAGDELPERSILKVVGASIVDSDDDSATVIQFLIGSLAGAITDAQHGSRSGGSLHSVATQSTAGFMSSRDKRRVDAVTALDRAAIKSILSPVLGDAVHCSEMDACYIFREIIDEELDDEWLTLFPDDATPGCWSVCSDHVSVAPMVWADFADLWRASSYRVVIHMRQGDWECDSVEQMPNGLHIVASSGVDVLSTLTPSGTGSPERAPFYGQAAAYTVSTTLLVDTVPGTSTIQLTSVDDIGPGTEIALITGNYMACYLVISILVDVVTVDRVVVHPFPAGTQVVDRYAPRDIRIIGNGMKIHGTFDAIVEISSALRCFVSGIHGTADSTSSGDTGFNLDVGSRLSAMVDCTFDGKGVFSTGFNIESAEACYLSNCVSRGSGVGILITKGYGCNLIGINSTQNTIGYNITSANGAVGSQSLSVVSCVATKNSGIGFDILNGASEVYISNCSAQYNGGSGFVINDGAGPAANVSMSCCDSLDNQNGLYIAAGVSGVIVRGFRTARSAIHGISCLGKLDIDGYVSTNDVSGGVETTGSAVVSVSNSTISATFNGGWHAFASGGSIGIRIRGNRTSMSGTGTKIAISHTGTGYDEISWMSTTGGTYGWFSTAGGLRRYSGVELRSCTTPYDVSSGGELSFGSVQLNGTTNVTFAFAGITAEDRPRTRRRTKGTAPADYAASVSAGVGVVLVSSLLDDGFVDVDVC